MRFQSSNTIGDQGRAGCACAVNQRGWAQFSSPVACDDTCTTGTRVLVLLLLCCSSCTGKQYQYITCTGTVAPVLVVPVLLLVLLLLPVQCTGAKKLRIPTKPSYEPSSTRSSASTSMTVHHRSTMRPMPPWTTAEPAQY